MASYIAMKKYYAVHYQYDLYQPKLHV